MKKRYLVPLFLVLVLSSCTTTISSGSQSEGSTPTSLVPSETYSITFFSEGGTSVTAITAEAGAAITKPADPLRQAYTFEGWYEDQNVWKAPFVFNTMPARNLNLYAKWKAVSSGDIDAYINDLTLNSKRDHLYIHYLRFNNVGSEYIDWDIWVWPNGKTGRIFDFEKDNNNQVKTDDFGGAYIEVDLKNPYYDGGHDGNGNKTDAMVAFSSGDDFVSKIGFLITYKSSRSSGSHWTSDGGDKFMETSLALEHALNGSLHLFVVQENTRNFTYSYEAGEFVNPYDDDDGTNVSLNYKNVDSSSAGRPISATSSLYKNMGVGYQIMVGSYADSDGDGLGDIYGIYQSLDYLVDLNVEAIWLTPVQLSDSYHGYDTIDYYNIDPKFGSKNSPHAANGVVTTASANQDYNDLVSAAKERGISVVMDLVLNHTSINNLLFQESISLNPEYRAYYHWRNTKTNKNWYQYSNYEYYYYGKFASSMPELNFDYQKTRDKIVDIMSHWVNRGVKGFRIDAVKHAYMEEEVSKAAGDIIIADKGGTEDYSSNLTKNLNFFREINARLKEVNADVFIFGENFDGHAYNVAPYYEGLDGMLNFWSYYNLSQATSQGGVSSYHHYNKAAIISGANAGGSSSFSGLTYGGKWNYDGISKANNRYRTGGSSQSGEAVDNNFTSNHDVTRAINQAIGHLDQAGEISAPGTVINSDLTVIEKQAIAYMAGIMLLPGVSWIYYGDELGMSSNMPSGSSLTTHNIDRIYRQPMKWDKAGNDSRTTAYSFSGAQTYDIAWDTMNEALNGVLEQKSSNNSMYSRMRLITAVKAANATLKNGTYSPLPLNEYANNNNVFAFKMSKGNETFKILINYNTNTLSNLNISGTTVLALEGATKSTLPPWSVLVTKS